MNNDLITLDYKEIEKSEILTIDPGIIDTVIAEQGFNSFL